MNAIIGDNGIITKAQEANIQNSIANLEEYLQLKYTENYEKMAGYKSKVEGLVNEFSDYFYIPINEGIGGLRYVVDKDGHALYLIKKSGLPDDIKESLIGGDAGEGTYTDYQNLNDVYGVTSNLKVYYCLGGVDSIKGLAKENLDNDNPLREVFDSNSEMSGTLSKAGFDSNGDGKISAEEAKGVKKLTINSNSGISSLKDLYNMVGLKELTLDEVTINSLDGIENASSLFYIYLKNCTIGDYSGIGKLGGKLRYLYLYNTTDAEISKLCDSTKGIANYDLPNLQYLAVVGNTKYINVPVPSESMVWDLTKSENKITTIEPFSNLSYATKSAVKFLSLQCNEIADVEALLDFSNVYLLRLEGNKITSLNGLQNMNSLAYLYANDNLLGLNKDYEVSSTENDSLYALSKISSLVGLSLVNNTNIIWIEHISSCTNFNHLYLSGCPNFNETSVRKISKTFYSCSMARFRSIDDKFLQFLQSEEILSYKNLAQNSGDLEVIESMGTDDKLKVKKLDLSGSTLDDSTLNEIIGSFPNLLCLNVNDCQNLKTLNFAEKTTKLEQILFMNTVIIGGEVEKLNTNCKSLVSFKCNSSAIDLTKMQDIISRCWFYSGGYCFETCAAGLVGKDLIKQLENCKNVTFLKLISFQNPSNETFTLDLSKCTGLKELAYNGAPNGMTVSVGGNNLERLRWWSHNNTANLTIEEGTSLDYFWVGYFGGTSNRGPGEGKLFTFDFPENFYVSKMTLTFMDDVNKLAQFFELIKNINIQSLEFEGGSSFSGTIGNDFVIPIDLHGLTLNSCNIGSLRFLSTLTNMENLCLSNDSITSIDEINGLTNLKTINFSGNAIRYLDALSNLKQLESLNLNGNLIEESAMNENGEKIENLKILANLNPNNGAIDDSQKGKLVKLYLENNKIIDYSDVSALNWTEKSGF